MANCLLPAAAYYQGAPDDGSSYTGCQYPHAHLEPLWRRTCLVATVAVIDHWGDWGAYPVSWPRGSGDGKLPPGVVPLNNDIRTDAVRRLARIRQDLKDAGQHYPRDQVREALAYWKVAI